MVCLVVCVFFVCEVLSILLFYIRTRPFMIYIYTYNYIHPEVLYCYTCNTCIVLCVVCLSLCVQCVSLYGADVFSFLPFLYKTREKKTHIFTFGLFVFLIWMCTTFLILNRKAKTNLMMIKRCACSKIAGI